MSTALILALLAGHATFPTVPVAPADGITTESLLAELADRDALARFPAPAYTCKQFSSYDRKSTSAADQATWFANDDYAQFIREEKIGTRTEWVMADAQGPGAIVHMWSPNPKGTLRIYIDGSTTPVLEANMEKLWAGELDIKPPLAQALSKGWNFYAPIPYAKSVKVTTDVKDIYYQVNYRTYPASTPVRSFVSGEFSHVSAAAQSASQALAHPATVAKPTITASNTIGPAVHLLATLPEQPAAIQQLRIVLEAKDLPQALRSTILTMKFDDEQTVWCPLGHFFATGVGANDFASRDFTVHALSADRVELVSRWTMPYQKSAAIDLVNLSTAPVTATVEAATKPWTWDDRSMHFYSTWRRQYPIHTKQAAGTQDWNYVNIRGQGIYVGDALSVFNPVKPWWGEGDEKISVDGETFPSHFGTGSEDYYGYGWCWPELFVHPLHGEVRCDGKPTKPGGHWDTMGYTSLYRTRGLDDIPFTLSLNFDIEVWHWAAADVEYAATSYFYAKPGAKTNRDPDPAGATAKLIPTPERPGPLVIKSGVECETAKVVNRSPGLGSAPQDTSPYDGAWSNDTHLWVQGRKVGDFIELAIPAPDDKPHHLILHATKSWDYGIIKFTIDGAQAAQTDLYSGEHEKVVPVPIDLGTHIPKNKQYILRAEVVGGNEKSEGNKSYFGLDCVEFKD